MNEDSVENLNNLGFNVSELQQLLDVKDSPYSKSRNI